jgi:SAM-dependent methyltransferase
MKYSRAFFSECAAGTEMSAECIVPLLVSRLKPRSVLDVGCGRGAWLRAFLRQGVETVLGIDGLWAKEAGLLIPEENFLCADLECGIPHSGRFDCGLCVEVAEHLSEPAALQIVEHLATHCDTVVFSAAIPGQGGTGHINEQWQSYWATAFSRHGYLPETWLRDAVWTNQSVEPWYRQNLLVFKKASAKHADDHDPLGLPESPVNLDVVHPHTLEMKLAEIVRLKAFDPTVVNMRMLFKRLGPLLLSKASRRLRRKSFG